MDRIKVLRLFVRLAEPGSFTAAARDLKVKQSTASKWIAELEKQLGSSLVERTTRSFHLTDAGHKAPRGGSRNARGVRRDDRGAVGEPQSADGPRARERPRSQRKVGIEFWHFVPVLAPEPEGASTMDIELRPRAVLVVVASDARWASAWFAARRPRLRARGLTFASGAARISEVRLRAAQAGVFAFAVLAFPSLAYGDDHLRERTASDEQGLMTVLAGWSLGSVAAGIPMAASSSDRVRYAGIQAIGWGAVDGTLAIIGLFGAARARTREQTDAAWWKERAALRRLFWINAALDVAYVVTGASLLAFGRTDAVRGTGAGVLVEGGFLLGFDSGGVVVMRP